MLYNKRIFITGGTGFVGSLLAQKLAENNDVCIYDNFLRNALQHRNEQEINKITIIKGDVLDYQKLQQSIQDFLPTHIIHCAAIAGIDSVIKSPTNTLRVNILGTANILNIIHELTLNLERIVLFSTSEVFGNHAFQSTESHSAVIGAVGEARWTYAVSKLADEHFGLAYFKEFNMPCSVVRPFNIYGPGQIGEGALTIFIKRAIKNEPILIHGDGNQIRSWCYLDDFLQGIMLILSKDEAIGDTFNIGDPRSVVTTFGLAQAVCRVLNSTSDISFSGRYFADVELRIPNITKSKNILGFEPKIDLEEGILRTAEFYKKLLFND